MKRLLLILLVFGCVEPGVTRPFPNNYAVNITGLNLVNSRGLARSEVFASNACFNHSTVLLYYSEFDNPEIFNYIVRIILGEYRPECLSGFDESDGLYHRLGLNEEYAWFTDEGIIIVEGTYSDLGGIEYNKTMLDKLVYSFKNI